MGAAPCACQEPQPTGKTEASTGIPAVIFPPQGWQPAFGPGGTVSGGKSGKSLVNCTSLRTIAISFTSLWREPAFDTARTRQNQRFGNLRAASGHEQRRFRK